MRRLLLKRRRPAEKKKAESPGVGGQVFLSFGSRRPDAAFVLQRDLARMGFGIESLQPDFNRYVGAGVLGGTGDLYRLVATEHMRPLVSGRFEGPLYTAQT